MYVCATIQFALEKRDSSSADVGHRALFSAPGRRGPKFCPPASVQPANDAGCGEHQTIRSIGPFFVPFGSIRSREVQMRHLRQCVVNFLRNEDGPTAVEYAVMLALIIVVCITAITTLGSNANNTFSYVATQVGNTGGS
jgi:pilus assembly protein Flp/PilA